MFKAESTLYTSLRSLSLSLDHSAPPHSNMHIQPLNPQRLVTILAHLLPPAYPLPPDLLSSALKTRQLYLPPNARNPQDDRHIAQRPTNADGTDADPERLSQRLSEIAVHLASRHQEFGNEAALQGEGNELEVALYKEASRIRYRALDGETLHASLDLSLPRSGIRILFVAEEGDEDKPEGDGYRAQISMGEEWKLFDVKPLEEEDRSEHWAASPSEAFESLSRKGKEEPEDDYWGGYSDEESSKAQADETRQTAQATSNSSLPAASGTLDAPSVVVTKKVTISPFVSRFNTPLGGPEDAYWSSYGNVEDGLKQSNPSSPRGVARQMTPAGYWGTGGESPVSWSPPVAQAQLAPASQAPQDATQPENLQNQLEQAATSASRRTEDVLERHEGHVDLSSPALDFAPGSPASEPVESTSASASMMGDRQMALRAALTGLKFMYINTASAGIDQDGLQGEFAQVLREFL
ncbi:hypothetical protein NliqN6_5479 [Naganishia liquefaciens]|uniref:Uncharacterized protein n=1 Tax=Naganishia liquefaciens TaxID=104408 RepID=A0A8H3TXR9_9TREE|nr:hypothetical protein NliqN6_5479 [Naganishia liquefaciens]